MMVGWTIKPLGDVLLRTETVDPTRCPDQEFDYIDVSSVSNETYSIEATQRLKGKDAPSRARRLVRSGDVLLATIRPTLKRIAVVPPALDGQICSTGYFVLRSSSEIDHRFLFYFLLTEQFMGAMAQLQKGASYPAVTDAEVRTQPISFPSLPEQRRIASILDEAFEAIGTAKANTEKNLQNANDWGGRAISGLLDRVCAELAPRPLESLVSSNCTLSYGIVQPGDDVPDGLPIVRPVDLGSRIVGVDGLKRIDPALARSYARTTLTGSDLLLCVRGTTGLVALAAPELAGANVTRGIVPIRFDPTQLSQEMGEFLLRSESVQSQIRSKTYGTALMQINIADVRQLAVKVPPLDQQPALVEKMIAVQAAADQLVSSYAHKLAALDELKQSLLHQAFTGQLTSTKQPARALTPNLPTTTAEFTANVIALAHARHERQKREKTFGRVKGQKTLHLVEAIAKIDLGREPIKDAAGPNDFQHMLKAEEWAKANGFFEMVKQGEGYEFKKLSRFDEHFANTRQAVGPHLSQLESIFDLVVPMDTKEAEVFATVHAAWNNLLIDGMEVTDDVIVAAAREGWHADKLKIPEHKFRAAIALIRQKGLVPDGSAKYVGSQRSLI